MKKPAYLIIEENKPISTSPILIVDKKGYLGELLCNRLTKDLLTVFVSSKRPSGIKDENSNLIYVPYLKRFPQIPENYYSYIFVVDDGTTSLRESIPGFIQKARVNKSPFIFITSLRSEPWKIAEDISAEYKSTKVIIYGDIFGCNFPNSEKSLVDSLIYQARTKKIKIIGNGMKKIFPVLFEDVIDEILRIALGLEDKSKIFYIFPPHSQTFLSFFHLLQRMEPEIQIDFIEEKKEKKDEIEIPDMGKYVLEDKYPIQDKIRQVKIKNDDVKYSTNKLIDGRRKKIHIIPYLKVVIFFLFLLLILPLISTILFSFLGFLEIQNASNMLDKGRFEKAYDSSTLSENFFKIASATGKSLVFEFEFIKIDKSLTPLLENIDTGKKIAKGINLAISSSTALKNIFSGNISDPKKEFLNSSTAIKEAVVLLKEVYVENNIPQKYRSKIEKFNDLTEFISSIQNVSSDLLGVDGKRKYLILFQNNMELRPGGGFIGSYGILTLDKGKITEFLINDVYDADGQLKGHVEPPYPIRRFLPKVHWYLRDSNFDVDFIRSAYTAAFFLTAEMNEKVDGVIGVDVSFVKNLLSAIGPVDVPEYNESVNSENLYIVTQSHSEKNFFPSSTQKKDFLRSLARAIQEKISNQDDLPYLSIFRALIKSIDEKHILLTHNNKNIQNLFTVNGWSSSLLDSRIDTQNAINDFIGINEANLGINKANYFIERNMSYDASINEDGSISSKATVIYKNNSTAWPGGDYKNYLRFILPSGSTLSQVFIDGNPQKIGNAITDFLIYEQKNFIPPQFLEVEKTEEKSKTIYGFLTIIPAKTSKTISIDYELPKKMLIDPSFIKYSLKLFKQPGTEKYPINFSLSYPFSYQITSSSKELKNKDNKSVVSEDFIFDKDIFLNLSQR